MLHKGHLKGIGVFSGCSFSSANLSCHPPVRCACSQVRMTERAVLQFNSVSLSRVSVCVSVCEGKISAEVMCAVLVKWTSMMQQPHTHTHTHT